MAIELYWDDDEQSVFLAEFNGKWTWDELHKVISKIKSLSQERGQVFGAILDLRKGMHLPGGNIFTKDGLNQFKRLLSLNDGESQQGPVVILGVNGMVKMVFDAIKNVDQSVVEDVAFAKDETDARDFIYKAVAKLNNNTAST